jgi:ABC-2 type transport system permease protein
MFETILAQMYKQYKKNIKSPADLGWIAFYPLIGLLSLGLFGLFIKSGTSTNPLYFIVVGVVVWNVYGISQKAITYGLTYDIWDECLRHTFLGKSTDEDFIIGNSLFGLITSIIAVFLLAAVAQLLFGFNILTAGVYLVIGLSAVFMYAVSIGLFINSLVLTKGYDWTSLIWMTTGMIMIISGVYYPVEILPAPVRVVSYLFPPTHSITVIRGATGIVKTDLIAESMYAVISAVIYLVISIIVYKKSVRKARETGALLWF